MVIYTPPPIIYHSEATRSYCTPYFYEFEGKILNLSAANQFYVDHIPFTSYYWPIAKIGSTVHHLSSSMDSEERALEFLRQLTKEIEKEYRVE